MRLSFPQKVWVSPLRTKPVGDGTQERHIQCSGGEHGGEGQERVGGGDQGQVQGGRQGGEQVHLRDLHMRVSFYLLLHNPCRVRCVFIQVTVLYVGKVSVQKWFFTPAASSKIEMSSSMWLLQTTGSEAK